MNLSKRLLTLAITASAVVAGTAGAAQAAIPTLAPNTAYELKFAHSQQILNVPNASNAEDLPLVQYFNVPGFKNDDFKFIKVGGTFGPHSYVIEAGKNKFGLPLYVVPREPKKGSPIVQDRVLGSYSVWDLVQSPQFSDHVMLQHRQSKMYMNLSGASQAPGAGVGLWTAEPSFTNDDIKISLAN